MTATGVGGQIADAGNNILSVSGLTVALPPGGDRAHAVEDISFEISVGETMCLVGESGSGKTVVADAIMGMLPRKLLVESGRIDLEGNRLPKQRSSAFSGLRSRKLSMIFQDAAESLNPVQRVGRQLEEILAVHGIGRTNRRGLVEKALESVQLPDPVQFFRKYPHQLSGGQAQRVVIAAALLLNPALLIADEPTTALDVTTQAEILRLVSNLQRERNMSVLFITHDFGVVSQIAHRVCVMKDGRIVESGSTNSVLGAPDHPYTRKLIAAAKHRRVLSEPKSRSTVLEVDNLHLTYRSGNIFDRHEFAAVRGISLTLGEGKTLAIVGESGSGKSSIARCILKLEKFETGSIRFRGEEVSRLEGKELKELRSKIQIVLQDPFSALNPRQTIRAAIAEGPIIHGMGKDQAYRRVDSLLKLTGLSAKAADRYPHEFSGGQRQRICIARALAVQPEILIADEAVSALDVSIQAQILDLFGELQQELGFSMVFITHDLWVASAISDDVLVMKNGNTVEYGKTRQVFETPRSQYTKELLDAAPRFSATDAEN